MYQEAIVSSDEGYCPSLWKFHTPQPSILAGIELLTPWLYRCSQFIAWQLKKKNDGSSPLNPWLTDLHDGTTSKRARERISVQETWRAAVGRGTFRNNDKSDKILYWCKEFEMSWLRWTLTSLYQLRNWYWNLQYSMHEVHGEEEAKRKTCSSKRPYAHTVAVFFPEITGCLLRGNIMLMPLNYDWKHHCIQYRTSTERKETGRGVPWLERCA